MKTVKLTTAVIVSYVVSSLPFIVGQLISVYASPNTATTVGRIGHILARVGVRR